jgi:hypothetical protein
MTNVCTTGTIRPIATTVLRRSRASNLHLTDQRRRRPRDRFTCWTFWRNTMTRINERSDGIGHVTVNGPASDGGGVGLAEPPLAAIGAQPTEAPSINPAIDGSAGATTAPAPKPAAAPTVPIGEPCVHCGTPMKKGQAWCLRCGYYPVLKTFVELDESEKLPEVAADGSTVPATEQAPKSTIEVWKNLIPRWGWGLIAGVAVLLVISLAARFAMNPGKPKAIWTWVQFGIGVGAVFIAHFLSYLKAIMVNDSLSFLDLILKPWAIWSVSVHELPKSFRRVALGAWGLSAAMFAALVVGGVKYDEIIDWGKVPPKKKSKPRIKLPIDAPPTDKSMEEALDDFANKAGVAPGEEGKDKEQLLAEKRQNSINCVIIGFMPHRENDFHALVLAAEPEGKLRWVGMVSSGIPPDVRYKLNRQLRQSLRSTPAVRCNLEAFWVEPEIKCTVKFEDWSTNKRMKNPAFEKLLTETDDEPTEQGSALAPQASLP